MSGRFGLLLLLMLLTACCREPAGAPPRVAAFGRIAAHPDAERWLGKDPRSAKKLGASNSEVVAAEAGIEGDRVAALVAVPKEECVLIIARGVPSVKDIDLYAYADDGATLGTDEDPDPSPSLLICPPHPTRLYVVGRIASGQGLVVVGVQRVSVKNAPKIAKALGPKGSEPGGAGRRLRSWPGLEESLTQHRRAIGGRWQEVRRVALPLDPRLTTRLSAVVEPGRCLDVLALPAREVSHLVLTATDFEGRIIGRGATRGRQRAFQLCSSQQAPVNLELRPHAGSGVTVVVLSRSEPLEVTSLDDAAARYDIWPPGKDTEHRNTRERLLQRAGYGAPEHTLQGVLRMGRRSSHELELRAGCQRIEVAASQPTQDVEAWLWAEDGKLIASGRQRWSIPLLACTRGGKVRLDVEARLRPGPYVVEQRREPSSAAELRDLPLPSSRLFSRMLDRGVIRNASQLGAPRVLELSVTKLTRKLFRVPVGRCLDVSVALGSGGRGVELRALDPAGQQLALARGTHTSSLRVCAHQRRTTLPLNLEVRLDDGAGRALLGARILSIPR